MRETQESFLDRWYVPVIFVTVIYFLSVLPAIFAVCNCSAGSCLSALYFYLAFSAVLFCIGVMNCD